MRQGTRARGMAAAVVAVALGLGLGGILSASPAYADDPALVWTGHLTIENPTVGENPYAYIPLMPAFSPAPDTQTYQWYLDGVAVTGATTEAFGTVPASDLGDQLRVDVTGSKAGYASTTVSYETPILAKMVEGRVTFSPQPLTHGQAITVNPGTWTPSDATFTYGWFGPGVPDNTTGPSYTPTDASAAGIYVDVVGHAPGYSPLVIQVGTGKIAPDYFIPATPTIEGIPNVYDPLTANPNAGNWNPVPASFAYQWNRDGQAIPGATKSTYTPVPGDQSHTFTVTVTAQTTGYAPVSSTSAPTAAIGKSLANLPRPTITGTTQIGRSLKAHIAPGSLHCDCGYSFIWYVDGVRDDTASIESDVYYPDDPSDVGKTITVGLVVDLANGSGQYGRTSVATAPLRAGVLKPGTVTLDDPAVGDADPLYVGPEPLSGWPEYDWYIDNVKVATGSWEPTAADWHHELKVKVVVTVGDESVTTTSKSKRVATGQFLRAPRIVGTATVGSTLTMDLTPILPTPSSTGTVHWYVGSDGLDGGHRLIGSGPTFVIPGKDAGKPIFAAVAVKAPHLISDTMETQLVVPRKATFTSLTAPIIQGISTVGSTLTASTGTWSRPSAGLGFAYQWFSVSSGGSVSAVKGATSHALKISKSLLGRQLYVRVTASSVGYVSVSASSLSTAAVQQPAALGTR